MPAAWRESDGGRKRWCARLAGELNEGAASRHLMALHHDDLHGRHAKRRGNRGGQGMESLQPQTERAVHAPIAGRRVARLAGRMAILVEDSLSVAARCREIDIAGRVLMMGVVSRLRLSRGCRLVAHGRHEVEQGDQHRQQGGPDRRPNAGFEPNCSH